MIRETPDIPDSAMAYCEAKFLPNPQPLLDRPLPTLPVPNRTLWNFRYSSSFHLLPRLYTYRSRNSFISLRARNQNLLISPSRPRTQTLTTIILQPMCYAIRIPLLHIFHIPLSPVGRFGCRFYRIQPVYFKHLPQCGYRLVKEVGGCRELFAERGGKAPSFEGRDGGK